MTKAPGTIIRHKNGQTSHLIEDDFADPWIPHDTILIQPGFGRHAAFWYHWVPVLGRHYRVLRRDSRGHGYSSAPGAGYDYSADTICEEIIDCMDQLGLDKVHFLGESTSGMVGEILACKYPHRLHTLTICSSPTFLPQAALDLFAFGHKDWPTACRELGSRGWAEALSKVPGTSSSADDGFIDWWAGQVGVSSAEGLAGYAEFLSQLDSRPYLAGIHLPMLILAPANSAATTVEEQKQIAEMVKGAKIEVINGRGHEIYVDMADECQKAFLNFLGGLKY